MAKNTRAKATSTELTIKLPQLVQGSIIEAEELANAAARERGPRWEGRAGIVVEAQPRGYLVYAVDKLSRFEELMMSPEIRHWA